MDFSLSPELAELRKRVRAFVDDERVLPNERAIVEEDRQKKKDHAAERSSA